jgi:hypothetical protein
MEAKTLIMQTATQPTVKASELRVGNWVFNYKSKDPVKVYANALKIAELDEDFFAPIPLTPELLEKSGFEQTSNYHPEGPVHTLKHRNGFVFEVAYLYQMVDVKQNIGQIRIQQIKYVHQLQNLFFALTGEELNISL